MSADISQRSAWQSMTLARNMLTDDSLSEKAIQNSNYPETVATW